MDELIAIGIGLVMSVAGLVMSLNFLVYALRRYFRMRRRNRAGTGIDHVPDTQ